MGFFGQQTINGLVFGCVLALYAFGFSLVLANLRVFHVAHAGVFAWSAIFAWQMINGLHWPLAVGLPLAAVLAGLLNVCCYFTLIRYLERRPNKALEAFISSLGGLIVLTELASLLLNNQAVRLPVNAFPIHVWSAGPLSISSIQVLIVGITLVAFVLLSGLVDRTKLGREMRAVAFDREAASLLGIDVTRVNIAVFFISGVCAGIGAVMVALAFNVINSGLGSAYVVLAMAAMVVGGLGSIAGVLAGGVIIGLASSYTTAYVTTAFRDVAVFGLLLVFLVVRPNGLWSARAVTERV